MMRWRRLRDLCCRSLFAAICSIALLAIGVGPGDAQPSGFGADLEHCRSIADDAARLRCLEEAAARPTPNVTPQVPVSDIGSWRLVRTPNPDRGKDAVSIMHTADVSKSDLDLAGLMVRCGQSGPEILIVLVRPLPPRAHPKVVVNAGGDTAAFVATPVPPGAAIQLPQQASVFLTGAWKDAAALSVRIDAKEVDDDPTSVSGVIPLSGLAQAERLLMANCPSQ